MKTNVYNISLLALMLAIQTASGVNLDRKTVASQNYVDTEIAALASHKVNGQALSNAQITLYGTSNTDATTELKEVTLYDYSNGNNNPVPVSIGSLTKGMVIVIKPGVTATGFTRIKITNVSNDRGVNARYNGANVPNAMISKLWNADNPSVWLYDGTYWNFVSGGKDVLPTGTTGYVATYTGTTPGTTTGVIGDQVAIANSATYSGGTLQNGGDIASVQYAESINVLSHKVNGALLSNESSTFYGAGDGEAANNTKSVRIASIQNLVNGIIIVVQPKTTSTGAFSLNLNDFGGKNVIYNGDLVTADTAPIVWNIDYPSTFVYDSSLDSGRGAWVFAGSGKDTNQDLTDLSSHRINGAPLSGVDDGSGNIITDMYFYDAAAMGNANSAGKTVSIPSITTLSAGQIIVVQPRYTSSCSTGMLGANNNLTIALNGGTAVGVKYNGSNVSCGSDVEGIIWNANYPSAFVYDGTNWIFAGSGVNISSNTVNGAPISNPASYFYDPAGGGSVNATTKTVSIPSITNLSAGQIITVKPSTTSRIGASDTLAISLNGESLGHSVYYEGSAVTGPLDRKIWDSDYPSTFVYDGTNWIFMGNGALDTDTTYDSMDVSEGTTGSATTQRTLTATNLKQIIQGTTLTGVDITATSQVSASNTITESIGQLQGQINAINTDTLSWGADETASANAYDITFVGDTGATANAWPTADKTKLVDGAALANGLSLKQNKIAAGVAGNVVTYSGNSGEFGTPLSVLSSLDSDENDAIDNYSVAFNSTQGNWPEVDATKLINGRSFGEGLSLKQKKLPAAWTSTTSTTPASLGGVTIDLETTAGNVGRRYITAGGLQALTQKSGADDVLLYINGTKSLAEYQTSNFGATGNDATNRENYIKGALVSLELLKDVYSALHTEITNVLPTGTTGYVATYTGTTPGTTTGVIGDQVAIANSATYSGGTLQNGGDIASVQYVESLADNTINGVPLSGVTVDGNLLTDMHFYGTSSTDETTEIKVVNIPEITTLSPGQIIVVKPTVTNAVANGAIKIQLNNFPAYSVNYRGNSASANHPIPETVWRAHTPSIFVYDEVGSSKFWRFAGGGADNTIYDSMTTATGTAGESDTDMVVSPLVLKNAIHGVSLTANSGQTTFASTVANTPITANDTVMQAFGHAQGQINNKQNIIPKSGNYGTGVTDTYTTGNGTAVTDWLNAAVKGTGLVTKTSTNGAAGERLIFEESAQTAHTGAYTDAEKIQIPTVGAILDMTSDALPTGTTGYVATYTGTTPGTTTGVIGDQVAIASSVQRTNGVLQNGDNIANVTLVDTEIAALADNTINGIPLSQESGYFYGTGNGAADDEVKTVSIPEITTVAPGQVIVVKPATTNTRASFKINLNGSGAYSVNYRGSTSNVPDVVWRAYTPSIFVLDESGDNRYWRFAGGSYGIINDTASGDYSGPAGTGEGLATISPKVLKNTIQNIKLTANDGQTTFASTVANTPITANDTVMQAFGHAQGQINNKQDKIPATSSTYTSTTTPTADGSVVTTNTLGVTGERGIATAPTYNAQNELTNGNWLPTLSAVVNAVSGATETLAWTGTETSASNAYSTTFNDTTNNWPSADANKLVNGTALANALALKQNILPAKDTASSYQEVTDGWFAPMGGQTIALGSTTGVPDVRYITKGMNDGLTVMGTAEMAKVYAYLTNDHLNAAVITAQQNFGDCSYTDRVKQALVSLELLRDVYLDLDDKITASVNALPTGTSGTVVTYNGEDPTTGVQQFTETPIAHSLTTTNGVVQNLNDIASVELLTDYYQPIIQPSNQSGKTQIVVRPTYGGNAGEITHLTLDTSALTNNDSYVPSSKLVRSELSYKLNTDLVLNTSYLNQFFDHLDSTTPTWAISNGAINLYRVPGAENGSNWASEAMSLWASDKNVPTMDTLANALAGLYNAVNTNWDLNVYNYDEETASIVSGSIPVPTQIAYTGASNLNDGNQLFWLPSLKDNGSEKADALLQQYSDDKIVPTMDELAYALDGVLQTNETKAEWTLVAARNDVDAQNLYEVADAIANNGQSAVSFSGTGYLQTFAPTLSTLMEESYALYQLIDAKQNKLSGTNGNLVTYGATPGSTGAKSIATTITNNANTVPNTAAVYNAVNNRQLKIPATGSYIDGRLEEQRITDWTRDDVKGSSLVTKTGVAGAVGERKIFEAGDTYTNNAATNIQIATIGAVMENTFTKECIEYRPGTSGETPENCWLWQFNGINGRSGVSCNGTGLSCRSDTECCGSLTCNNNVCENPIAVSCIGEGESCSALLDNCCSGTTCSDGTCTRSNDR